MAMSREQRESAGGRRKLVKELTLEGLAATEIGERLGIHPETVSRIRRYLGLTAEAKMVKRIESLEKELQSTREDLAQLLNDLRSGRYK